MKLLLFQSNASHAIATTLQKIPITTVITVQRILKVIRVIAIATIQTLVTQCAIPYVIAVVTVLAAIVITTIHTVLIIAGIRQKIAILRTIAVVVVITIYRIQLKKTQPWSHELKLFEFGNKIDSHRKIYQKELPNILPKTLLTVDHIWRVRRIRRDHIIAALIALSLIQISLITHRQPFILPTLRADNRHRKLFFCIKGLLLINDQKVLPARLTCTSL